MSPYEENRTRFPLEELQRYQGQWVAFSMDGKRILASSEDLIALNALLITAGEDPHKVALERIDFDDHYPGGPETLRCFGSFIEPQESKVLLR